MNRILIILILSFLIFISRSGHSQEKPNIIFILADDLGYGDLSSYGAKDIQTPHIDSLAKTGIKTSISATIIPNTSQKTRIPKDMARPSIKHPFLFSAAADKPSGVMLKAPLGSIISFLAGAFVVSQFPIG